MTTTGDLIEEARTRLLSGQEERVNRLDGAVTNNATALALKYAVTGAVASGVVLDVDLEEIRVWEVNGQSMSTVERAVNGSAAAAHADLATVTVSPKFSRARILRAFNEELLALSSAGLYQMKKVEFSFDASAAGYDLVGATAVNGVWMIEGKFPGLSRQWVQLGGWRLAREANTTDFPSGFALFPGQAGQPGQTIRVWYKAPLTTLSTTDITATIASTGLAASAEDLLPLGAMLRLVPPRDVKRTFTEGQGEPRRAEEVPINAATQSISGLARFRQQRINDELAQLARLYPSRSRAA